MSGETIIEKAERHVQEARALIRRQEVTVTRLERDGHACAAMAGRKTLEVMRDTLRIMLEHLELEKPQERRSL